MTAPPPTAIVDAWHAALRSGDLDALAAVTDDDVELAGPRGAVVGLAAVQDWALRSGIRLEPRRSFSRDGQVVVEQVASWRDPETGAWTEPTVLASVFSVDRGKIARIARYPDLPAALAATNLTEADGVGGVD